MQRTAAVRLERRSSISFSRSDCFHPPSAFASTLEKHVTTLAEGGRRKPKDAMSERILRKAILRVDEDYANDQSVEAAQSEAVEEATRTAQPLSQDQQRMLTDLRQWAQRAKNQPDSKATAILAWLETHLRPGGKWNERRVILFTEYRTTHQWMHEILASHGFGGERLGLLHGGLSQDDREPIKAAFQASPNDSPVRILLATDAASEGIDLQNHCNYLIHLEIPYNPNVMEQRNGRIDRHGQREKEVLIWHPVDGGEAGHATVGGHGDDILRALRKLESMRADMGSVNPVIAPQMSGLIEGSLTDLDTRLAEANIAKARRFVRAERGTEGARQQAPRAPTGHTGRLPPHTRPHAYGGEDRPRARRSSFARTGRIDRGAFGQRFQNAFSVGLLGALPRGPTPSPHEAATADHLRSWCRERTRRRRAGSLEPSAGPDLPAALARRSLGARRREEAAPRHRARSARRSR